MRIDIITVLPEMLEGFVNESILARAQKKGLAEICLHNLRNYTKDKWRRVDDYPYGGFAGMVMQCEPIDRCISALKAERTYDEVIFTTPDGEQFSQHVANDLSLKGNIIILCGHYKGIDQRIRDHLITREISIGDYVLTGGELAAGVMAVTYFVTSFIEHLALLLIARIIIAALLYAAIMKMLRMEMMEEMMKWVKEKKRNLPPTPPQERGEHADRVSLK